MKRVVLALLCGCGSDRPPTASTETDASTSTASTVSTSSATSSTSSSSSSGSPTSLDTSSDEVTTASNTTTVVPDGTVECTQCDLFMQDCGAGERCVPWSCDGSQGWNGTRCSAIAREPAGIGEPCTMQDSPYSGLDDCERGAMCWDVDVGTLEGTCIGLCIGSASEPSCADDCAECLIAGDSVLALCIVACDPLAPDCDAGEACYLVDETYVCAPTAAPDAVAGDPCDDVSDCGPGYTCVNGDFVPGCRAGAGCCTVFCTVGDPGGCDELPGSTCTAVFLPGQGPACVADTTGICVE